MGSFVDLTGQRFGRLTVEGRGEKNRWGNYRWKCVCDCGGEKEAESNNLRRGLTNSCGCYMKDRVRETSRTHGMTGTPEYVTWVNMLKRCYDPKAVEFPLYGARGIKVCRRWKESFGAFFEDMGPKPRPQLTLERVDNDKGYSPDNCRWADRKAQARNTRRNRLITHNGRTQCLVEWSEETGLKHTTIAARLDHGWSVAEALETPVKSKTR